MPRPTPTRIQQGIARAYRLIADVVERLPPPTIETSCLGAGGWSDSPTLHVQSEVLEALAARLGVPVVEGPFAPVGVRQSVLFLGVEVWAVVTP